MERFVANWIFALCWGEYRVWLIGPVDLTLYVPKYVLRANQAIWRFCDFNVESS